MRKSLSPGVRAGLDVARALAAIYVVVHHVAATKSILFRFGQEAVLVFFLLSGFVVFANEKTRALHPRGYYLRRLRRIYPVLLFAMAISTIIVWDNGNLASLFSVPQMLATLASLQDISTLKPGVIADPYLGNAPLWSLSYEVVFYLIFPPVLMAWTARPAATTNTIGLACCMLYVAFAMVPNHFTLVGAYFLVWWCGAMAADSYMRGGRTFLSIPLPLLWLAGLCATAASVVVMVGYKGAGYYPALPLRHFAVALLMLAGLFGPIGRIAAQICNRLGRPATAIASISFGLYVLHYPLLITWNRAHTVFGFTLAVAVLIALSYVAEHVIYKVLPRASRT